MPKLRWAVAIHRRDVAFESELGAAVCRCLEELGHSPELVCDGDVSGLNADVLLLLVNLANFPGYCNLLKRDSRRPVVILWQMDPLPPETLSAEAERTGLAASEWRRVFRLNRPAASMPRWKKLLTLIRVREWAGKQCSAPGYQRAWRLMRDEAGIHASFDWLQVRAVMQAWAAIREAHRDNRVDFFVASTLQRRRFLVRHGIVADFVPVGAYEETGRDLGTPRDIDVAFLGDTKQGRRAAMLVRLERSLERSGLSLKRIDSGCYGDRRTALLNRTRILVNLHKYPWSPAWIRFLMAASCGTLVVSEPAEDDRPFVAGEHYVAAPLDEMHDTILNLLNHQPSCDRITRAASALCRTELTLRRAVRSLCEKVSTSPLCQV